MSRFFMSDKLSLALIVFFSSIWGWCGAYGQDVKVPPLLEPWQDWVNETVAHRDCPRVFNDHGQAICY